MFSNKLDFNYCAIRDGVLVNTVTIISLLNLNVIDNTHYTACKIDYLSFGLDANKALSLALYYVY